MFHFPRKLAELVRNVFCKRKVHIHKLLEESDLWDASAFEALANGLHLGAWRSHGRTDALHAGVGISMHVFYVKLKHKDKGYIEP